MDNSKNNISSIKKIFGSIDNLLIEGKQQKLKMKLSRQIKKSIFTEDIMTKFNECDFSGMADEEDNIVKLFDTIFPVFVKNKNAVYRLYKHKIEVDLSDDMRDRYIYMFSDGRLTSGLFKCFNLDEDEYVYGIKKIIDIIPLFKKELTATLADFQKNIENKDDELNNCFDKEKISIDNYKKLNAYLEEKIGVEGK